MSVEISSMTPFQYWTRWGLAGAGFLLALAGVLYMVVTRPIVSALVK